MNPRHRHKHRRAPAHSDEPMMDINTTPLIDVMLVLLIMLIITIPVQLDAVKLNLPIGVPPPLQSPAVVRVDVGADSLVRWNGEPLPSPADLAQRMEDLARQPEPPELHLRPDADADYAVVAKVMATAQRTGLTKVGIVGSEQFAP